VDVSVVFGIAQAIEAVGPVRDAHVAEGLAVQAQDRAEQMMVCTCFQECGGEVILCSPLRHVVRAAGGLPRAVSGHEDVFDDVGELALRAVWALVE